MDEAAAVVQIDSVEVERHGDGSTCRVEGMAVASFRGGNEVGKPVEAEVPCRSDDMSGPTIWHEPRSLQAPVLKLHPAADGRVARYGAGVLTLAATSSTSA